MRLEDFQSVLIGAKSLIKQDCLRGDLIQYFSRSGINITPFMLKDLLKNVNKIKDYNWALERSPLRWAFFVIEEKMIFEIDKQKGGG